MLEEKKTRRTARNDKNTMQRQEILAGFWHLHKPRCFNHIHGRRNFCWLHKLLVVDASRATGAAAVVFSKECGEIELLIIFYSTSVFRKKSLRTYVLTIQCLIILFHAFYFTAATTAVPHEVALCLKGCNDDNLLNET